MVSAQFIDKPLKTKPFLDKYQLKTEFLKAKISQHQCQIDKMLTKTDHVCTAAAAFNNIYSAKSSVEFCVANSVAEQLAVKYEKDNKTTNQCQDTRRAHSGKD